MRSRTVVVIKAAAKTRPFSLDLHPFLADRGRPVKLIRRAGTQRRDFLTLKKNIKNNYMHKIR